MTDNTSTPTHPPRAHPTYFERERGVTQIAVEHGVALVTVHCDSPLKLLKSLADARVPVNHVKLVVGGISFVVSENHVHTCTDALTVAGATYTIQAELAVLRTIAGAMRDLSGVVARIYEALLAIGVSVRLVGDAYDSVFGLVSDVDADRAAEALRQTFALAQGDKG